MTVQTAIPNWPLERSEFGHATCRVGDGAVATAIRLHTAANRQIRCLLKRFRMRSNGSATSDNAGRAARIRYRSALVVVSETNLALVPALFSALIHRK
jgi:hypothetical protein